jgi:hypothetical protein
MIEWYAVGGGSAVGGGEKGRGMGLFMYVLIKVSFRIIVV